MITQFIVEESLQHHGIEGQKWGVRRFQRYDGTLTEAGRRRLEKKDDKWIHKNENKIYKDAYEKSKYELNDFVKRNPIQRNSDGSVSLSYLNAFNQTMASVMNKNVADIESPSGRVVKFVAKRGNIGVYTALADRGYDMDQVKRGVFNTGKIAYKKKFVDKAEANDGR